MHCSFINNSVIKYPIKHLNKGAKCIKKIVTRENVALALGITSTLRYSEIAIHALAGIKDSHLLGKTSFLSIGSVPLCAYEIGKNLKEFHKSSLNEKSKIFLKVVSSTSSIGYSVWTFLSAVQKTGVTSKLFLILPVVGIASAALEGVAISLDAKELIDAYQFSKQLSKAANLDKKIQDYTLADFQQGMNFIEEQYGKEIKLISNFFEVDDEQLVDHLFAVERIVQSNLLSANSESIDDKELLFNTMRSLQKRVTLKKWSHAVNIASAATDIVGVGLLFTPVPAAGYGCFAVAGGASIGLFGYKKWKSKQFKATLLSF